MHFYFFQINATDLNGHTQFSTGQEYSIHHSYFINNIHPGLSYHLFPIFFVKLQPFLSFFKCLQLKVFYQFHYRLYTSKTIYTMQTYFMYKLIMVILNIIDRRSTHLIYSIHLVTPSWYQGQIQDFSKGFENRNKMKTQQKSQPWQSLYF